LKQIDLLYKELVVSVLKDVDVMILRAGGNYLSAATICNLQPKTFYKHMTGDCSFATALIIHRKISTAVKEGAVFYRKNKSIKPSKRGHAHHSYKAGRKKKES